jgi:hypothetical protein
MICPVGPEGIVGVPSASHVDSLPEGISLAGRGQNGHKGDQCNICTLLRMFFFSPTRTERSDASLTIHQRVPVTL